MAEEQVTTNYELMYKELKEKYDTLVNQKTAEIKGILDNVSYLGLQIQLFAKNTELALSKQ